MATEKSIDEFIRAQQADDYPPYPEQLAAIEDALRHHDKPLAPLAEQIAERIIQAEEIRDRDPKSNDYEYSILWRTIAAAIKELTSQIDRIAELVVALTEVKDPHGYMAFNQDMTEHWNEFALSFTEPKLDDPERANERQAWININAFNAKISNYGIERLDYRLHSAHVFRIALEETPWEVYHWPDIDEDIADDPEDPDNIIWRDEQLEQRSIRKLNYWAPAAAAWIVYDGKGIYGQAGTMIGDDHDNYEPTNWYGDRGFSKLRFQYWCGRFEWIAQVTALDHDTRKRARDAAALMRQLEQGP